MSLPAGPMISLAVALEGFCTIIQRDGGERRAAVEDFVTGNHKNVLRPGDLLRRIDLPSSALRKLTCISPNLADSPGTLSGAVDRHDRPAGQGLHADYFGFYGTTTAIQVCAIPSADDLRATLEHEIPVFFDDVHGTPEYRKHMTFYFAEEIRRELSGKIPHELHGQRSDFFARSAAWAVPANFFARNGMVRGQKRL